MTHLILHKVRGEPAFDVAEKIQIGDEEGWIIPTSGHRAYPVSFWELDHIRAPSGRTVKDEAMLPPEFKDWPDHYQLEDTGHIISGVNVMEIISRKLLPKIKRRL